MKATAWQRCLIVLMAFLGIMSDAKAQEWFVLDPLDWALVLDFDGYWRDYKDSADTQQTKFEEGVRLRQRGHSVDPRIASFFLDLHPRLAQVDFENGGDDEDFDNSFLDYNASLSLLHGTPAPFSFEARAGQNTATLDGDLGSRTDLKTSNEAITLNARNEFFPSTITFSQRDLDEKFRSGISGATTDREEAVDTVTFRGHSSKMDLLLEQIDFDDRLPKDNDYNSEIGRLNHSLRWGKGSNLHSLLDYYKREDFLPYERVSIDESARLQHTRNLFSSYDYNYSSVKNGADTKRNYARAGLTHQFYRNLTTSAYLKGSDNEFESGAVQLGEEKEREARLDLSYTKKIPHGGRLSAGLGVAEGTVDRDVEELVVLQVFDEPQLVDATYIIILNERFIDTSTIVVTAPGCSPCTPGTGPGTDYEVVPAAKSHPNFI